MSFPRLKSKAKIFEKNVCPDLLIHLADFSEFSFSDVGVANDRNNLREGHYNV